MKCIFRILAAVMLLSTLNHQLSTAFAQGTAFTYQGRLNSSGSPANGSYDLAFTLYTTNVTGTALAGPVTNAAVAVTNGLFTTMVDFGNAFTGGSNWLAIAVSTNGANSFFSLTPRQQVTPTPYAIMAENVSGLSIQNNPDGAPNVVLGASVNFVSPGVEGATIGGGGEVNKYTNSVTGDFGTVGGGIGNTASAKQSTVAGGFNNTASNPQATVAGGYANTASGLLSTVAGGNQNIASGDSATVAGGVYNTASGTGAFIGGGGADGTTSAGNTASGNASVVSGGLSNQATKTYAAVSGGYNNIANDFAATVGGGEFNISSGDSSTVGGGQGNTASGNSATVGGGYYNIASGDYSFAAGNTALALNDGAFVWADDSSSAFASTANNQFLVRAQGGVGINTNNPGTNALMVNGNVTATSFTGSGSGLTGLQGANLTGAVPSASLTSVPSASLTGTINNARLSGVALTSGGNAFTGNQTVSSGSVGIGTSTPNAPLAVVGNIYMGTQRANTTFNQIGDTIYLGAEQKFLGNTLGISVDGSTDWINLMANSLSAGIMFGVSSSTANPHSNITPLMVIKSNGNVGIGATNPVENLTIAGVTGYNSGLKLTGSTTGGTGMALENTAAGGHKYDFVSGGAGSTEGAGAFALFDETAGSFRLTVSTNGNVGIGTATPATTLDVNGQISAGSLRSPGAGINSSTFAFTQLAVGTNTTGNGTVIHNPLTDGDPNAILIITHNWTADTNSTSKYNIKPVGVYYSGPNWIIFNEDTSTMALGRAFNVMVIKP
jgi:hypothetical protein